MYVRKVKKDGKTYLYYYKSQRIGNKVKSIYVGKALEKPKKINKVNSQKIIKDTSVASNLIEFDNLLFEITKSISIKDLKSSINIYNKMLEIYSKTNIDLEDKQKLFNKLNNTYQEILNLSKEYKLW